MKTVLTIAGSDCSGGAGIQADIKTMIMNGVYAMSAITALTAQNTTGVYGIQETSPEFLDNQLDCIFTDIFPDAVKIGMLSSAEIMHHVAVKLQQYHAHHIVLDPVMISTSGHRLMDKDAEQTLQKELFPLAEIITPNIPEAEALTGLYVGAPRDALPETASGEYYWGDLLGLDVTNVQGDSLGRVVGLIETAANDVLRVADSEGKERLLPFVEAVVKEVSVPERRIRVDWELDW